MSTKPATVIDAVCGMTVSVATAEASGLTIELEGRTYAFCRAGYKRAFEAEPHVYVRAMTATRLRTSPAG